MHLFLGRYVYQILSPVLVLHGLLMKLTEAAFIDTFPLSISLVVENSAGHCNCQTMVMYRLAVITYFPAKAMTRSVGWSFLAVWDASGCLCVPTTKSLPLVVMVVVVAVWTRCYSNLQQ